MKFFIYPNYLTSVLILKTTLVSRISVHAHISVQGVKYYLINRTFWVLHKNTSYLIFFWKFSKKNKRTYVYSRHKSICTEVWRWLFWVFTFYVFYKYLGLFLLGMKEVIKYKSTNICFLFIPILPCPWINRICIWCIFNFGKPFVFWSRSVNLLV